MTEKPEWMIRAKCKGEDPGLFFPQPGDYETIKAAKAICAQCDVRAECFQFALVHKIEGVWGGSTESQRRTGESVQELICPICETMFLRSFSVQKFCSDVCRHKADRAKKRKVIPKLMCPVCDEEFQPALPYQKYCSKPCRETAPRPSRIRKKKVPTCTTG